MNRTTTKKIIVTDHAASRLNARRINHVSIELVLNYGRQFYANGALVYFVGKKEVKKARALGTDISSLEGTHLIFHEHNNGSVTLLTGFKNHSLKRYKH